MAEYVDRVAAGACAVSGNDGPSVRWAAQLSAAALVGIDGAALLRQGVPIRVVRTVELLRSLRRELPLESAEGRSAHRVAVVIRFVELNELASAAPGLYNQWHGAHRRLGQYLGLPFPADPRFKAAEDPEAVGSLEYWLAVTRLIVARPDSRGLDTLLEGYATVDDLNCRGAIRSGYRPGGRRRGPCCGIRGG